MKHPICSTITFALEEYKWNQTETEARTEMWKDISTQLQILLKNQYEVVLRDDDTDIIVIEYEHDENKDPYGCDRPMWVTMEEYEKIWDDRVEAEEK